jgi:RNA 3'-terminal phosphate cyclase
VTDLTERLTEAAVEAIRAEAQALAYEPHRLRGITVELEIANNGAVIDGRCWVERKVKARRS